MTIYKINISEYGFTIKPYSGNPDNPIYIKEDPTHCARNNLSLQTGINLARTIKKPTFLTTNPNLEGIVKINSLEEAKKFIGDYK